MDTFIIKRDGVEIARVTGENMRFSKIAKRIGQGFDSEMVDDPFLFRAADPEDDKALFVVALAHHKNLTVEKI